MSWNGTCPRCQGELAHLHHQGAKGLVCLTCRSQWWVDPLGRRSTVEQ